MLMMFKRLFVINLYGLFDFKCNDYTSVSKLLSSYCSPYIVYFRTSEAEKRMLCLRKITRYFDRKIQLSFSLNRPQMFSLSSTPTSPKSI